MFYNYLIFNMVTLSLRILLKYCVSLIETFHLYRENTKYNETLLINPILHNKEKLPVHPFLVEHNSVTDVFRFSNFM